MKIDTNAMFCECPAAHADADGFCVDCDKWNANAIEELEELGLLSYDEAEDYRESSE